MEHSSTAAGSDRSDRPGSGERCEVLIVGGGPAGSSCAGALTRAGLDVLVMDKREFPRDKVCAGWVTPPVMQALNVDLADYARGRTLQPIRAFRSGALDGRSIDTDYAEVVSYGIRRCEFDHYLLQRSRARLQLGSAVERIERRDNGWLINGRVAARVLIGAGGHFCPVARWLDNSLGGSEQAVAAQEIEFELTPAQRAACPIDGARPQLWFLPDLSGYAWCFRKGDYLNVGLGSEDNHRLAERVQGFADTLIAAGSLPADMPRKFKGHAYLLYATATRPLSDDGVLLIGDAAGLAYTQSGEGIRPAVESGLLAAAVLKECHGDYSRARLAGYAVRIQTRFGPRSAARASAARVPAALKRHTARLLLANRWFTRHVVLDRWFLHRH